MKIAGRPFGIIDVPARHPPKLLSEIVPQNKSVELLPPQWTLVIDLPLPPSVNRVIGRLGNKSPVVQRWIRAADAHLMSRPAEWRRLQAGAIKGVFTVNIIWDSAEFGRSDWDNRIKVLMDYLQRLELIENDRLCRGGSVSFGTAPQGCQVRLRSCDWDASFF